MNGIHKTLYIPLYGKAYVSQKGIILQDKKAEEIWHAEKFPLKGKSRSKWLAYSMGMRAAVMDDWTKEKMAYFPDAVILHIGCGMDSRAFRIGHSGHNWYDVDFSEVIAERKRYYEESEYYRMIEGDARKIQWLSQIPQAQHAIIVMEGISMYLPPETLKNLIQALQNHFSHVSLLMDCYTRLGAALSRIKNPIHDVGAKTVYGMDQAEDWESRHFSFVTVHEMNPDSLIRQLPAKEQRIFKKLFAGKFAEKLYQIWEYQSV